MKPETKAKLQAFAEQADRAVDWFLTRLVEGKYTGVIVLVAGMIVLLIWLL